VPSNSISLANSIHPRRLIALEKVSVEFRSVRPGRSNAKGIANPWEFEKLSRDGTD